MRKIYVIAALTGLMLTACQFQNKSDLSQENLDESDKSVSVVAEKVKVETIRETTEVSGEIRPLYEVKVYPKVRGIIVSEKVSVGKRMKEGQLMAEIEQDVPGLEFSRVQIKAPREGTITRDLVETGSTVSVQTPLYTISKIREVYLRIKVIQSLLGKIHIRDPVTVRVDTYPSKKFSGRVSEISPTVDPRTRTGRMKVRLSNPRGELKPGMFARAELKVGEHKGLVIPLDALIQTGTQPYVFKVEENQARRIEVSTGVFMENQVEVEGQLQGGDPVVVFGQNRLQEGTPVSIEGKAE
ncbi:efflux RND transporter periplasmic adaptor subunit [bacterium]|nr:efflux RND transporter periplasmic adaptor subunit [bacterium]